MKTLLAVALFAFCSVAVGCNTMEGAGQDIEWTGEQLQDAAN